MTLVMTVLEAARALGISRGLAYEAVRTGQIPSIRIGGRVLVPRARLLAMLNESEDGPAATGPPSSSSHRSDQKEMT